MVKNNNNASLSKGFRNAASLRLETWKVLPQISQQERKISAAYNTGQNWSRKMYSASHLSRNITQGYYLH
jgi:hypothetical protein